jgi:XTP/dITP diphosphohydrolase
LAHQGTLVLASNNKGKIAEFEKLFEQLKLPVEIIPQGQLIFPMPLKMA